jgi:hypothetical protein
LGARFSTGPLRIDSPAACLDHQRRDAQERCDLLVLKAARSGTAHGHGAKAVRMPVGAAQSFPDSPFNSAAMTQSYGSCASRSDPPSKGMMARKTPTSNGPVSWGRITDVMHRMQSPRA